MTNDFQHDSAVPESALDRMEEVCEAFELSLRKGDCPRIEDYLDGAAHVDRTYLLLELVRLELAYSGTESRAQILEAYKARFPDVAAPLGELFAAEGKTQALPTKDDDSSEESGSQLRPKKAPPKASTPGEDYPVDDRYRIEKTVGQGGIGLVFRGYDQHLGRSLAVKVLRPEYVRRAELRDRFLAEARIGSRLQHPSIVPVHDVGEFADGRPFFTMKLVEGKTLRTLLEERKSSSDNLARFVDIFEQICQAIGYAHSQGVIHRDLKPANVMVGAFGEVQVMDWGLAKQLPANSTVTSNVNPFQQLKTVLSGSEESTVTVPTPKSVSTPSERTPTPPQTQDGSVMGTLAYMPPEQARGEIDRLNERADVFALGAILCTILTGKPPYWGKNISELHQKAKTGDLAEAQQKLNTCGADSDLIDLALRCLSPDQQHRLANAGKVAQAIEQYQTQVQERLREKERQRAAAVAKAEEEVNRRELEQAKVREERRRRRVIMLLGMVAALFLLAIFGAGTWYRFDQIRQQHEANDRAMKEKYKLMNVASGIRNALDEASALRKKLHSELRKAGGVRRLGNDPNGWEATLRTLQSSIQRADTLWKRANGELDPQLYEELKQLKAGLSEDEKDYRIVMAFNRIRDESLTVVDGKLNTVVISQKYPAEFLKAGLDIPNGDIQTLVRRLQQSLIREQFVAALDHWLVSAYHLRNNSVKASRLLQIVRGADSNPLRKQLLDPNLQSEPEQIEEIAQTYLSDPESMKKLLPETHSLIGRLVTNTEQRERWLRTASSIYPTDLELAFQLGHHLLDAKKYVEAEGCYKQALAIQPKNASAWNNWGIALHKQKNHSGAIEKFTIATQHNRTYPDVYNNWGNVLDDLREYSAAIEKFTTATQLDPNHAAAYNNWGVVLHHLEKHDEAIEKFKVATRIDPRIPSGFSNWGLTLYQKKMPSEAIEKFQQALSINPNDGKAYCGWGVVLSSLGKPNEAIEKYKIATTIDPNFASAYTNWGNALAKQQKYSEAAEQYRIAASIEPKNALTYSNWGGTLHARKRYFEAIEKYKISTEINPKSADTYYKWGVALHDLKNYNKAIEKYNKALQLNPESALAYVGWGNALAKQQKYSEAIEKFKTATRIDPNYILGYTNWATALFQIKKFDEEIRVLNKAIQLQPKAPLPLLMLGSVYQSQGRFQKGIDSFQNARKLLPQIHPWNRSAQSQIRLCQQWLEREHKLPAVLEGNEKVSAKEMLALVELCVTFRKRYRDATTLYTQLFRKAPMLANNPLVPHRYNAACAAVMATSVHEARTKQIDSKERTQLRQKALRWLQADLKAYSASLENNKKLAGPLAKRLDLWQTDADLQLVRDRKNLADLPEGEQQEWNTFWAKVATLRKAAESQ